MRRREFISVIAGATAWPLVGARRTGDAGRRPFHRASGMSHILLPHSGRVWLKQVTWTAKT